MCILCDSVVYAHCVVVFFCCCCFFLCFCFFFFQAEDGIRDHCVTGVQTGVLFRSDSLLTFGVNHDKQFPCLFHTRSSLRARSMYVTYRSEERREGKSVDLGGRRIIKKKK